MSAHARLSASSAHRWLACPPSVQYASGSKASIHAATGTFAHSIAAKCLESDAPASDFFLHKGKVDGFDVECDLEMVAAVQDYLDDIRDDLKPGDQTFVEVRLVDALSRIDPDLGGTADHARYRPETRHLLVRDFKYGSGVYVDADDNAQMKIYALGVMLAIEKNVKDVTLRIVQPRFEGAKPVRDWHFKASDILDFVADVKEAANASRTEGALYKAGEHCKFCPGARVCPELERRSHAIIGAEFDFMAQTPSSLPAYEPKRLAAALASIPMLKERIKAIEEFAYTEAAAGKEIPGFKLVEKRATRKWKSEGDVIEWAQAQAVDPYAPRELLSPAQLEKVLSKDAPKGKKKDAGKVLEQFVERVSSGTALVPVSDDRPPAKLLTVEDFALLT